MRKPVLALVLCVTSLLGACSSGGGSGNRSGEPFKIAMILGTSGPSAKSQQAVVQGAEAAAAVLNAQGGILGRKVEVKTFDSQGDPTKAVRILHQDILTSSWDELYFSGPSTHSSALIAGSKDLKTVQFGVNVTPNYANKPDAYPYFFNVNATQAGQAAQLAQYFQQHYTKIGVLTGNDATGAGTHDTLIDALTRAGIQNVSETFDVKAVDVTSSLLRLQKQNLDVLFVAGFGAPAGHILTSLGTLGWNIPTVGDVTMGATNLAPISPADVLKNLKVQVFRAGAYVEPAKRTKGFTTYLDALKTAGPVDQGLVTYAVGYDAIMLTDLAAKQANSTDEEAIVKALEALRPMPADQVPYVQLQKYDFTPTSHQTPTGASEFSVVPFTPLTDGMMGATS